MNMIRKNYLVLLTFFLMMHTALTSKTYGVSSNLSLQETQALEDMQEVRKYLKKNLKLDQQEILLYKLIAYCNIQEDIDLIFENLNGSQNRLKIASIEWLKFCAYQNESILYKIYRYLLKQESIENDPLLTIYILDALFDLAYFKDTSNQKEKSQLLKPLKDKLSDIAFHKNISKNVKNWIQNFLIKE